jgi:hypothetical protein
MKIFFRLLREFSLPAITAVAWTVFSLRASGTWSLTAFVTAFAPAFFLCSWATGQFFRVKKQVGVERNFSDIETRLGAIVDRLEQHSRDFLGYVTGAEGFVSFEPAISEKNTIDLMLMNDSKYPVFDIQAEAIDLDEPIDPKNGKFWTRHRYILPSLYPSKAIMTAYRFDMTGRDRLKVNLFVQTRRGGLTQEFRVARVGNWYSIAFRTRSGEEVVKKAIPKDFPGFDAENEDAVFA